MARAVGIGGPRDPRSIPLSTRKGTWIPNVRRQKEIAPAKWRISIEFWKEKLPKARLRSCTAAYNCVGLAFASRRTWVDTGVLPTILREDGYRKLADPRDVKIGDLVIYRETGANTITHIGLIVEHRVNGSSTEPTIIVMSKWGALGEYIHPLKEAPPQYGEPAEFWTERRPAP